MATFTFNLSDYDADDVYSPTDLEREPGESEEDYGERIQDLEDFLESFDD